VARIHSDLRRRVLAAVAFSILLTSIAGAQTPGATPAATDPKETKQLEALSDELFLQGLMDPFDYDPRGRKDPFAQPVLDRPVAQGAAQGPLLPL
jgi:hypothetical protein